MMRIIDKYGKFLRDDIVYDIETENAINADSPQGLWLPQWNGIEWEESATQEYIDSLTINPQPTLEDRVTRVESDVDVIITTIATIEGVI